MKYYVIFLSVFLVEPLGAIDLSGLLSDSDNKITANPKKKPDHSINLDSLGDDSIVVQKKKKLKISGSAVLEDFLDPDYQNALNILNNVKNNKIYDAYLASIRESFMTYYLMNAKAVKKIVRKSQIVDLSGLEQLSNQPVIKKKGKDLSNVNLASLTDVAVIKKVKRKEKVLNIDQLLNNAESLVVVKKTSTVHSVNLTDLQQPENNVAVSKKVKVDKGIGLSSLVSLNQENDTDVNSTQAKKNKPKKRPNLSSLLNN